MPADSDAHAAAVHTNTSAAMHTNMHVNVRSAARYVAAMTTVASVTAAMTTVAAAMTTTVTTAAMTLRFGRRRRA